MFVARANLAGFAEIIGCVRQSVAGIRKLRPQKTDQNQPLEGQFVRLVIAQITDHVNRKRHFVQQAVKLIADGSPYAIKIVGVSGNSVT